LDAVLMVADDGTVHAACHGGERDSGRFRKWFADWKATSPSSQPKP
jgi:carbamoyltransferase